LGNIKKAVYESKLMKSNNFFGENEAIKLFEKKVSKQNSSSEGGDLIINRNIKSVYLG